MTNVSELMERYRQLTRKIPPPSSYNEAGESISILSRTKWLRILLIRNAKTPQNISIEVESSLPNCTHETYDDTENTIQQSQTIDDIVSKLISDMITHLQYLLQLHKAGFTLDVIKQECLWTASKTFTTMPEQELFKLLLPP